MKRTMIGKKYGMLTVLGVREQFAICRCDCGNAVRVWKRNLYGNTRSCGCIKRTQDGFSHLAEYNTWTKMIKRCYLTTDRSYPNYGGRGIKVSARWRDSFSAFLHDMGTKPHPGFTIERIDNNGPYQKSNCRWIPRGEQNWNTRKNHMLTFKGKTQHISKWAREVGMPSQTLLNRIVRLRWSVKDALTKPRQKTYPH